VTATAFDASSAPPRAPVVRFELDVSGVAELFTTLEINAR
jgi:hypothetical protein